MRSRFDWQACQPNQALTALRLNMVVQITPNAASGGFQVGCFSWKYQASKTVKDEPMPATAKLIAKATSRLRQWVFKAGKSRKGEARCCEEPIFSE